MIRPHEHTHQHAPTPEPEPVLSQPTHVYLAALVSEPENSESQDESSSDESTTCSLPGLADRDPDYWSSSEDESDNDSDDDMSLASSADDLSQDSNPFVYVNIESEDS